MLSQILRYQHWSFSLAFSCAIAMLAIGCTNESQPLDEIEIVGPPAEYHDTPSGRVIHAGTEGRALPPPPARSNSLTLAILPDQTTGRRWGLEYLRLAVDDLNHIQPDAVISIGDMVQGYTRDVSQWDREVDEFFHLIDPLKPRFYPLAGNHEVVHGNRQRDDVTFETRYQQRFAPLYYAIEFDEATAIVLYSDDREYDNGNGIGKTQLHWLKEQLADASARDRPIVILLHRPLWRSRRSNWDEQVHPLLVEIGVDAVIAGHFHSLQRDPDREGIQYHLVGTCGGMIDQLPVAGQLQHLTFIHLTADGQFDLYHQPVGMTLPDDFILREDQDRVFKLKNRDVLTLQNPSPDPVLNEVDVNILARIRNPVDVPVTFSFEIVRAIPAAEPWAGERPTARNETSDQSKLTLWQSRMEFDRFNPFVTDIDTSFALSDPPIIALQPGESDVVELQFVSPAIDLPRNPPEIHATAVFIDSKSRVVPVRVRARLPIQRVIEVDGELSQEWPICSWDFEVYETLEANPQVQFSLENDGAEHAKSLTLQITVPDNIASSYADDSREPSVRRRDPMSDAVKILIGPRGREREFYFDPFMLDQSHAVVPESSANLPQPQISSPIMTKEGWQVTIALPSATWADMMDDRGHLAINIGIADNDETYHTQWRWLAPAKWPAILSIDPLQ